jgi:cell division protein ZapB
MDKELASLAQKIQLASELCHRLRKENQNLRQELVASQQRLRQLNAQLDTARTRVESLIDNLPTA